MTKGLWGFLGLRWVFCRCFFSNESKFENMYKAYVWVINGGKKKARRDARFSMHFEYLSPFRYTPFFSEAAGYNRIYLPNLYEDRQGSVGWGRTPV